LAARTVKDLLDSLVAAAVAGALNVAVLVRTIFRQPRSEGAFLARLYASGAKVSLAGRLLSVAVLVGALAGGFSLGVRQDTLEAESSHMSLNQLQATRADQTMWGKPADGTDSGVLLGPAVATAEPAVKSGIEDHDFVFPREEHDRGFVRPDRADHTRRT
jgi:hypothetical protein